MILAYLYFVHLTEKRGVERDWENELESLRDYGKPESERERRVGCAQWRNKKNIKNMFRHDLR